MSRAEADHCSPIPVEIGRALVEASRSHRQLAVQLLAPIGLHPGQEILVFLLEEGPTSPGELADRMGVEPATVTKMVRRTEATGLVVSEPSAVDRRMRVVRLTDTGREAAAEARRVWQQLEDLAGGALTEAERSQLISALNKVAGRLRTAGAEVGAEPIADDC